MEKCKSCHSKFSFLEIFKSFWKGYKPIECSHCHKTYEHTFKNRIIGGCIIGIGSFISVIMMSILNHYYHNNDFAIIFIVWLLSTVLSIFFLSIVVMRFLTFEQDKSISI
jgi:CXXC-20-CXXC protein